MAQQVDERKTAFKKTIKDSGDKSLGKIGDLLLRAGQITKFQLDEALQYQKKHGGRLGSVLVRLGYIENDTIVNFLSRQYNFPVINIGEHKVSEEVIKLVPYDLAKDLFCFPVSIKDGVLTVAMVDPTSTFPIETLQNKTKLSIKAYVATEKSIIDAYKKYYKISDEEYNSFLDQGPIEDQEETVSMQEIDDFGSLASEAAEDFSIEEAGAQEESDLYSAEDAPIIKLVNGILLKAVKEGISDIHIEPFEKAFYVRYRLDGALYQSMNLPLQLKNAMISRIKILSHLDISERRVPQDGRIKMKVGARKEVDFRVSTLPTLFGESIVLRILDKSNLNVDLTKLGFTEDSFQKFKKAIYKPYGLVLVTGPTGSGKTTTLYSALSVLNTPDRKILTAEDPVEFNFKGVNQVLVREEVGLTFAAALKSFLRQDPDVIMVGEIRDLETAEIAIKAAMTGHMVFSTLHTNDCPSTVGRLIDIGVPGYMVSSAVSMVLSQRLLRRICTQCKTPVTKINASLLKEAGFLPHEFSKLRLFYGKGCPACGGTGYKGRVAIYEVMEMTEVVREAVTANVPEEQLRKIAMKEGMYTLRQEGLKKVKEGVTTLDEVLKKTIKEKEIMPAYLLNPDEQVYEDGDLIIKEGNTDDNFYKLIQGRLVVTVNGVQVGEITQPGEYFGEMSAVMGTPRTASVWSKGKSVVKVFPGDKLKETIEKYPDIALKLISSLTTRLQDASYRLSGQHKEIEPAKQI
jgi:type IV pilus assembly protein PilB